MLVPIELMRSTICCSAPSPIARISTTNTMPITIPNKVRKVLNTLARNERIAMRVASPILASMAASVRLRNKSRNLSLFLASIAPGAEPPSLITAPSRNSITRSAFWATLGSWVMMMTVWPLRARFFSNSSTSLPLWESRAPVGSSARMILPPFISARAMETRCCWPPDNWVGRWSIRSPRPSDVSSASARTWRSLVVLPA